MFFPGGCSSTMIEAGRTLPSTIHTGMNSERTNMLWRLRSPAQIYFLNFIKNRFMQTI
jgi:hypothetical protein